MDEIQDSQSILRMEMASLNDSLYAGVTDLERQIREDVDRKICDLQHCCNNNNEDTIDSLPMTNNPGKRISRLASETKQLGGKLEGLREHCDRLNENAAKQYGELMGTNMCSNELGADFIAFMSVAMA